MNTNRTRCTAVAIAIALSLSLLACQKTVAPPTPDSDLRKLVIAGDTVANTVAVVQKSAIDFEAVGALSRDQTRAIMQLSIVISQANNRAMGVARELSKLDDPSKAQLLTILTPVLQALEKGLTDPNIVGIQNQQTRDAIRGSFLAIQTSLNSMNLMLSVGK